MKKLLLGMTSLALLFIFVLAGCSQPTETTVKSAQSSIPGPSNLKYAAEDGVTFLWWDAVVDASAYRVLRKDTVTGITVQVKESTNNLYYADTVTWNNQMENGRKYDYTVISLNSNGINTSDSKNDPILCGSTKTTVTAKIPLPADFKVDISDLVIDTNSYVDASGQDRLLVTFDGKPNLSYDVKYNYGKNLFIASTSGTTEYNPDTAENLYTKRAMSFPLLGGKNNVSVEAKFVGGLEYYGAKDIKQDETKEFAKSGLPAIYFFSATRVVDKISDVKLEWQDVYDVGAFANSTIDSYAIYRAEVDNVSNIGAVKSEWVPVTKDKPLYEAKKWIAYDRNVPESKEFFYVIIATVDGAKSVAKTASTCVKGTLGNIQNFKVRVVNGDQLKLEATWDADVNLVYKLNYAPVVVDDALILDYFGGTSTSAQDGYALDGDYLATPVTIPTDKYKLGKAVYDFSPDSGSAYVVKLTAENTDGTLASASTFYVIEKGAFKKGTSFTLTQATRQNDWVVSGDTTKGKFSATAGDAIRLKLNTNGSFTGVGYKLELYYRTSSNQAEVFKPVEANWTDAKWTLDANYDDSNDATAWSYTVENLPVNAGYQFKLIVKNADGKIMQGEKTDESIFGDSSSEGSYVDYSMGYSVILPNGFKVPAYSKAINDITFGAYHSTADDTIYDSNTDLTDKWPIRAKEITGSNLENLKLKIEYTSTTADSTGNYPRKTTDDVKISAKTLNLNYKMTGTNNYLNNKTYYYITLPADYDSTESAKVTLVEGEYVLKKDTGNIEKTF